MILVLYKYIVEINLELLKEASVVQTGVAIKCDPYLSNISKVEEAEDKDYRLLKYLFMIYLSILLLQLENQRLIFILI